MRPALIVMSKKNLERMRKKIIWMRQWKLIFQNKKDTLFNLSPKIKVFLLFLYNFFGIFIFFLKKVNL